MLRATCASIIAAAALVAVPVSAQTTDYGATTSMSTDTRGTTGTGDQYMRTQENYTASPEEAHFEATGQRMENDARYTGTQEHYQTHASNGSPYSSADLDDAQHTTGTGDQYMRNQENYTKSPEEAYFDETGQRIGSDPRYSDSQEWSETEGSRYHMHQQALVPGSSHDAWWASDSLTNQSREGYVGTPFLWDSQRYYPDPSFN